MSKKTTETKAEFARRMGVSRQRAGQWAKDGLPVDAAGEVKITPALRWLKNRIPQISRFSDRGIHLVANEGADRAAPSPRPAADGAAGDDQPPEAAPVPPEASPDAGNLYIRARAAKMAQDARRAKTEATRAELELRARQGELLDGGEVRAAAFNKGRLVRDGMLNIPDRIAPILAGEADEKRIHEILAAEIRRVLEELSGGPVAEGDDAQGS